ncbi:MAG: OmpA family protein [Bacteroidetes bacterium]|nr:OmpA family protein [Bacteroidota bacterium]
MKKIFVLLFFVVVLGNCGFSQVSETFKTKYILADNYIIEGNYEDALPIFLFLDTLQPGNPNISFNIGICYINSILSKTKAIPYLERAVEKVSLNYMGLYDDITAPVFAYYYLGRAYMSGYKIDDAITNLEKFKNYLTEKDSALIKDANRQIEMCYNAKKLMLHPVTIKIENLGQPINSAYPEYSPVVYSDESSIIFTSRRAGSTCEKKDVDGKYFEDIYIATLGNDKKNRGKNFMKIGSNINTCDHEASVSISNDSKQLFIYKDDNGDGNIYVSNFVNDEWSALEKLPPEINSKYWETHASLSADGTTLYFVSNRSGGFGGRDIWMCEKLTDGNWSKAINLGATINTEYDEESPFILPDGVTLYFASKGHESMGGFDIFTSTLSEQGVWSTPENIGYPINTTDDDVFYVPTKDEKHAYYASAKEGGFGDLDIYKLYIVAPKEPIVYIKGNILDDLSYRPIVSKIEIIDSKTHETISKITSDKENGEYYVSLPTGKTYKLTVSADNYIAYQEIFVIPDTILKTEISKTILLQSKVIAAKVFPVKAIDNKEKEYKTISDADIKKPVLSEKAAVANIDKETKIVFDNKEIKVGDRVALNNVLFDFDKSTLRPESIVELNKWVTFLKKYPDIKIELSGHTDNIGNAEYNNLLSDNRTKTVIEYFISQGILKDRMQGKGYGFNQPVATNDNDADRQKNRRTEIRIIGY